MKVELKCRLCGEGFLPNHGIGGNCACFMVADDANDPKAARIRALEAQIAELRGALEKAEKQRGYAIRWANQSVEMLQASFFPVADALRDLERYLRDTPHHNAIEAAAARKAILVFDTAEVPKNPEAALQHKEPQG